MIKIDTYIKLIEKKIICKAAHIKNIFYFQK